MNVKEFIKKEQEICDAEYELIEEIVKLRNKENLSQRGLSKLTNLKQPAIARLEKKKNSPQIGTVLKILRSLGYTLVIVPLEKK